MTCETDDGSRFEVSGTSRFESRFSRPSRPSRLSQVSTIAAEALLNNATNRLRKNIVTRENFAGPHM